MSSSSPKKNKLTHEFVTVTWLYWLCFVINQKLWKFYVPVSLLLTNFQVDYHKVTYHTSLQNKQTRKRTAAFYIKLLECPSFNRADICPKTTVFVQKGSDNASFLSPKPPWTALVLCYFPHQQWEMEEWLSRYLVLGPEKMRWRHRWEDWPGSCILKYSSYHGSVNELKDNLQIERLCYPSEMEHGEDRGNF